MVVQYVSLQSYRQYQALRKAVARQVEAGNIINHATDKLSVFDQEKRDKLTSSVKTHSLRSNDAGTKDIIVGWESERDSLNPRQWPLIRRTVIFALLWINVFAVDWASSCDSQVNNQIEAAFGVSSILESLSPSIYTFGRSPSPSHYIRLLIRID